MIFLALLALVMSVEGINDAMNLTAPLISEKVMTEQYYAPSSPNEFQNWTAIAAPTNSDRVVHATVYDPVNDKIYMIGGNPAGQTGTYLTLCQQYDPATNTWINKASMPTARGWLAGSYVRGKIYIIGGHSNSGTALTTNEEYDIATNTWSTKTACPVALVARAEVVWRDSLIYCMGGNNLSAGVTTVNIYDPFSNSWTVGANLPQVSYMGTAGIIGDTIYIAQAYNGSACWSNLYKGAINPANPTQITWTPGPAMTQPVFNGGTAVLNGNVYWLGGFISGTTVTNLCWKYEPATNTISTVVAYPQTLARCNYMVGRPSANELYVMAGDAGGAWTAPNNYYYKISYAPPAANDVGVDAILSPGGYHMVNTPMTPSASVKNYGTAAQTNFPVVCSIVGPGGAFRYTDTKTVASLGAGVTTTVDFDLWTPTTAEQITTIMRTNLVGDSNPSNNRKTKTTTVGNDMLFEGFNDATFPPSGWQAVIGTGTYNWQRFTVGASPTCSPYEGAAMTGYLSYNASAGSWARLISPPIALGSTPQPLAVKFYMYHDPAYPPGGTLGPDSVKVEYSTNGTIFTRVAAFRRYEAVAQWTEHTVNLGTFSGTVYVAFVALSEYGDNMYVDYIRLMPAGIEEDKPNRLPTITTLNAPKPNPATNGLVNISFNISEPTKACLKIYDASGRVVRTLVNSNLTSGVYNLNWNGTDDNNNEVAEGIYFYTLETSKQNITKKLVFTR
jgi:N-acetylneuraminic acid mutarotase